MVFEGCVRERGKEIYQEIENNLIKFVLIDELCNFAEADLARPPSSKAASSSLTLSPFSSPNSTRLMSE